MTIIKGMDLVGIYRITSPSQAVYIGQSWNIAKRFRSYTYIKGSKKQCKLHSSFIKYGVDKHIFEVLQELPCDVAQEVMDSLEIFFINRYKECGFRMMNISMGGRGGRHSEETKLKLSLSHMGRLKSLSHSRNISIAKTGTYATEECKRKMSLSKLGKPMNKYTCPYCGTVGGGGAMFQWHFDNCRHANN